MLGGPTGLLPDRPATDFSVTDILAKPMNNHVQSLRVPARLSGRISYIGPLRSEVVAKAEQLAEWRSLIWKNNADSTIRDTVFEQSALFLQALVQFDEQSQNTVFPFDHNITWKGPYQQALASIDYEYESNVDIAASQLPNLSRNGCRLFLLQPPAPDHSSSWMGLAPRDAEAGDLICHVAGIERAVILRCEPRMFFSRESTHGYISYRIIGCAGLAMDRDTARQFRGANLSPSELFAVGNPAPLPPGEEFNIYMDIHTAFMISR